MNDLQPCGDNTECLNVCIQGGCSSQSDVDGPCDETPDFLAGTTCVGNLCQSAVPELCDDGVDNNGNALINEG